MTALGMVVVVLFLLLVTSPRARRPRALDELPEPDRDVMDLMADGQELAAISAYRLQTGASLLEASRMVRGRSA